MEDEEEGMLISSLPGNAAGTGNRFQMQLPIDSYLNAVFANVSLTHHSNDLQCCHLRRSLLEVVWSFVLV